MAETPSRLTMFRTVVGCHSPRTAVAAGYRWYCAPRLPSSPCVGLSRTLTQGFREHRLDLFLIHYRFILQLNLSAKLDHA
jgi:hypothetical protein